MAAKKRVTPDPDTKVAEIRATFDRYQTEFQPIRDEADEDMRYVSGDPWSEQDKRLRQDAMRPVQVNDELHQFYNQVINDVRMNPRAVKFSATPELPNPQADDTARFYNDKWREIEYRSNAIRHYITALENCIYRSYGWVRVTTRYTSPRSDLHDLWIEGVPNPNMILPDPDALSPTSADARGIFAYHDIDVKEFQRKYPDAEMRDFGPDVQKAYPRWVKSKDRIQLAEFWEVQAVTKKLVVMPREVAAQHIDPEILADPDHEIHQHMRSQAGPVGVFENELVSMPTNDDDVRDIREVEDRKVVQYLTNGVEILKTKQWRGKYLPFASCFGKVLYLEKAGQIEKQILSMTRLARQPYMAMCYLAAAKLEMIGMMPKFPYFYYKGSLSPRMLRELQKSVHEPVAGIEVDPYPDGHNSAAGPLPPPIRQPYEPPLQAIEIAYESERRSVQAAMGISPLPTPAQRNNQKTGAALQRIESSGQKGSFHYIDNYDAMIQHVGVIGEDLMEPTLDTARTVATLDALKRPRQIRINDPNDPEAISVKGKHVVTVSSAPAESSAREAAGDFVQALVQSPTFVEALQNPTAAKVVAMGIRLQNIGLIGDEVADLLDPPPNAAMTPQIMQAQMGKAQQALQAMQAKIAQLTQEQAADTIKAKGTLLGKQIDAQNAITLKTMDDATKITVAMIGAKTKTDISENESRDEAIALGVQVAHEERLSEKEHTASSVDTAMQHVHDVRQALLEHRTAMAQAAQDHSHAIQQILAQASVQPEQPTPTDAPAE